MTLRRKAKIFTKETLRHLRYDGLRGLQWPLWMVFNQTAVHYDMKRFGFEGENIFTKDWDLLVILDACRVDLIKQHENHEVLKHADWGTNFSVAPNSKRFLEETFINAFCEELRNTAMVSANPFTSQTLKEAQPDYLDEVWRYAWDDELGTVPARAVTDRGIAVNRETNYDRYIVHYMQPHFPSIPAIELGSKIQKTELDEWEGSIWDQLLEGDVSKAEVIDAYEKNLQYVLNDVEILLSNFDAENVVISADHGNAMGERSFYGHQDYPVREIWEVPWIKTTAVDERKHNPNDYERDQQLEQEIDEQLSALGYK